MGVSWDDLKISWPWRIWLLSSEVLEGAWRLFYSGLTTKFLNFYCQIRSVTAKKLQRREAIEVFREICSRFSDAFLVGNVILRPSGESGSSTEDYSLHIKVALFDESIDEIAKVVERHRLCFKRSNEYLVIYGSSDNLVEVPA